MAGKRDDELLRLQAEAADMAVAQGADPGALATQLAGMQTQAMGQSLAQRYAQIGARWLADQAPTRLDAGLIERLARLGFRRESLADVKIHRGTRAQAAADALTARAFAVGDGDVFFGRGEFDPHSSTGFAVLAHELAHVAPPSAGPGGVAPLAGGGIPSSFGGPVVNRRVKDGEEDAAGEEAHEQVSRATERQARREFALDDAAAAPAMAAAPSQPAPVKSEADAKEGQKIDPAALEAKVMQILQKWERAECERVGMHVQA